MASQSGLEQKGVFGSQKLKSETGSWEEIRLGTTLIMEDVRHGRCLSLFTFVSTK